MATILLLSPYSSSTSTIFPESRFPATGYALGCAFSCPPSPRMREIAAERNRSPLPSGGNDTAGVRRRKADTGRPLKQKRHTGHAEKTRSAGAGRRYLSQTDSAEFHSVTSAKRRDGSAAQENHFQHEAPRRASKQSRTCQKLLREEERRPKWGECFAAEASLEINGERGARFGGQVPSPDSLTNVRQ